MIKFLNKSQIINMEHEMFDISFDESQLNSLQYSLILIVIGGVIQI